jgi:hypothetical protein
MLRGYNHNSLFNNLYTNLLKHHGKINNIRASRKIPRPQNQPFIRSDIMPKGARNQP